MIGWLILLALAAAAAALLWRFGGLGRDVWQFVSAALMLAAAGYVWQGSPAQRGSPVAAVKPGIDVDPEMVELRGAMTERFGTAANWLIFSDALLRAGETRSAVTAIRSGINENPRSAALWAALGSALIEHDGGNVSPTARFAFSRAVKLDPASPAPWFFLGLAEVRAGNPDLAERLWTRALTLTPPQATYRRAIELRLVLLRQVMEMERSGELSQLSR